MGNGRNNFQHGGGSCPVRGSYGGGGRRYHHNQPNRGGRRWRNQPQHASPRELPTQLNRPPVQRNQPAPKRARLAAGPASPAPTTLPPQPGNDTIQVSRGCRKTWRAICFPFPFPFQFGCWLPRLSISFAERLNWQ